MEPPWNTALLQFKTSSSMSLLLFAAVSSLILLSKALPFVLPRSTSSNVTGLFSERAKGPLVFKDSPLARPRGAASRRLIRRRLR